MDLGTAYVQLASPVVTSSAGWLNMAPTGLATDLTNQSTGSVQAIPEPTPALTVGTAVLLLTVVSARLRRQRQRYF